VSYGIIFWWNSCHNIKIFWIQKRVIRIITDCGNRESCRILFKKLESFPLISQYMLSLLVFVVNNRDQFLINSEIHNINIRHISNRLLTLENYVFIKREFTIQVLRFSVVFHLTLKNFPII